MSIIQLKQVTKTFGKIIAINQMDLTISSGEYVCILGQTGAGKTGSGSLTSLQIAQSVKQPRSKSQEFGERVFGVNL